LGWFLLGVLDKIEINAMICHKCGKVIIFEKIIDESNPEKKAYHIHCWESQN